MHHRTLLNASLTATIFFLILTLTSVILTVTGWVFGDWFVYRIVKFDGIQDAQFTSILVFYITSPTDACVVAGTVGLAAAIVCVIAWSRVRKAEMDLEFNMVCCLLVYISYLQSSTLPYMVYAVVQY
jgi:hypothetical protein